MLQYYHLEDHFDAIKDWYDGYRFGNVDVYCPGDVISYCAELRWDPTARPRDYWSNTSGNDVIRHFIEQVGDGLTKAELESLVAGETVTKENHEELTYRNLYDSIDNIWSLLCMTGYLTQRGQAGEDAYLLTIPNREIRRIFTKQIMSMFKENVAKDGERLAAFCNVLQNGDVKEVERQFTAYLEDTISIRDTFVKKPTKENFYHGILIGLLGFKRDWDVKSNKESGDGYSDIIIRIEKEKIGIVIEVKYANDRKYEPACKEAMDQIEREKYAQELKKEGFYPIYKYGVACFKRECRVVMEQEESGTVVL